MLVPRAIMGFTACTWPSRDYYNHMHPQDELYEGNRGKESDNFLLFDRQCIQAVRDERVDPCPFYDEDLPDYQRNLRKESAQEERQGLNERRLVAPVALMRI